VVEATLGIEFGDRLGFLVGDPLGVVLDGGITKKMLI
jgi:hypothetical protein